MFDTYMRIYLDRGRSGQSLVFAVGNMSMRPRVKVPYGETKIDNVNDRPPLTDST
jgi:hypothetical protein